MLLFPVRYAADGRVVRRVLKGRHDEYAILVERYAGPVEAAVRAVLPSTTWLEDAAQEAFVKAFQKLDTLNKPDRFGPWLLRIARNTATSFVRKHSREEPLTDEETLPDEREPEVERRERERVVQEAMDRLDPEHRETLFLYYFAGKRVRDIARLQEISQGAAAKRLQRARTALGAELLASLGEDAAPALGLARTKKAVMAAIAAAPAAWCGKAQAATALTAAIGAKMVAAAVVTVVAVAAAGGAASYLGAKTSDGMVVDGEAIAAPIQIAQAAEAEPAPVADTEDGAAEADGGIAADMTGPCRIEALLQDMQKRPVPGAKVKLEAVCWDYDERPPDNLLTRETESGADGRFVIENLPAGGYCVIAIAEASSGAEFYRVREDSPVANRTIPMRPRADLSGVLLDQEGNPVTDAIIYPIRHIFVPNEEFGHEDVCTARAETGADGRFDMPGIWPGKWQLYIWSESHPPVVTDYIRTPGTDTGIRLPELASVSGTVVRKGTEEPVPGAGLALRLCRRIVREFRTDEDGHFEIAGLCPGAWRVEEKDSALILPENAGPLELEPGQAVENCAIEVEQGGVVMGQVYDRETGEGVGGIEIRCEGTKLITDNLGGFILMGLAPGTHRIGITAEGTDYVSVLEYEEDAPSVTVRSGETVEDFTIALDKGVTVPVCLRAAGERDYTDVRVRVTVRRGNTAFVPPGSFPNLDASGCRDLTNLPGDADELNLSLHCAPQQWSLRRDHLKPEEAARDGVTLTLDDPASASLSGAIVQDSETRGYRWSVNATLKDPLDGEWRFIASAEADGKGAFAFPALLPGSYFVGASRRDDSPYMMQNIQEVEITLRPGEERTGFLLEKNASGKTGEIIRGRVVDMKGEPVLYAEITVYAQTGPIQTAPERDGYFSVQGIVELDPDSNMRHEMAFVSAGYGEEGAEARGLKVTVVSPEHSGWLGEVLPGTTNLLVRLKEHARLDGRVRNAQTGAPVPEFRVRVSPKDCAFVQYQHGTGPLAQSLFMLKDVRDGSGAFALEGLAALPSLVTLEAEGYVNSEARNLDLKPGMNGPIAIDLEPAAIIHGVVLAPDGSPLPGASIHIGNYHDNGERLYVSGTLSVTTSGPDGTFRIDTLPPGETCLIYATHRIYVHQGQDVETREGGVGPITLRMTEAAQLEVTAFADGEPVEHFSVDIGEPPHRQNDLSTNSNTLMFRNLPPGPVTVRARAMEIASSESGAKTRIAGQEQRIDVDLKPGIVNQLRIDFDSTPGTLVLVLRSSPEAPDCDRAMFTCYPTSGSGEHSTIETSLAVDNAVQLDSVAPGKFHASIRRYAGDRMLDMQYAEVYVPPGGIGTLDYPPVE